MAFISIAHVDTLAGKLRKTYSTKDAAIVHFVEKVDQVLSDHGLTEIFGATAAQQRFFTKLSNEKGGRTRRGILDVERIPA